MILLVSRIPPVKDAFLVGDHGVSVLEELHDIRGHDGLMNDSQHLREKFLAVAREKVPALAYYSADKPYKILYSYLALAL